MRHMGVQEWSQANSLYWDRKDWGTIGEHGKREREKLKYHLKHN